MMIAENWILSGVKNGMTPGNQLLLRVKGSKALIPGQAPDTRRFHHLGSARPSPAPTLIISRGKISQHKPEKQTKSPVCNQTAAGRIDLCTQGPHQYRH